MSKLNALQKERLQESVKNKKAALKKNEVILKRAKKGKNHESKNP